VGSAVRAESSRVWWRRGLCPSAESFFLSPNDKSGCIYDTVFNRQKTWTVTIVLGHKVYCSIPKCLHKQCKNYPKNSRSDQLHVYTLTLTQTYQQQYIRVNNYEATIFWPHKNTQCAKGRHKRRWSERKCSKIARFTDPHWNIHIYKRLHTGCSRKKCTMFNAT